MLSQMLMKVVVVISSFNLLLTTFIYLSKYPRTVGVHQKPDHSTATFAKGDVYRKFETAWYRAEISSKTRDFYVDSNQIARKGPNVPMLTYQKPMKLVSRNSASWVSLFGTDNDDGKEKPIRHYLRPSDVYFSIRTTESNHHTRVPLLLDTWVSLVPRYTRILTDEDDITLRKDLKRRFGDAAPALIPTDCPRKSHSKWSLLCKLYWEFQHYTMSGLKESWFCHFDDDAYVNVNRLLTLLSNFDPTQTAYLGRAPSKTRATVTIAYKLDLPREAHNEEFQDVVRDEADIVSFHFALGGAGFCISRALAEKMLPVMEGWSIVQVAASISLPDDCVFGYVITHLLNVSLTNVPQMHSHIEDMTSYTLKGLSEEVTYNFILPSRTDAGIPSGSTSVSNLEDHQLSKITGPVVRRLHSLIYGRK